MTQLSDQMLSVLDDELIERFKRAIEIGKWPDGRALTAEQKETCMQAIIVYEHNAKPPEQRTGYLPPKPSCDHTDMSASSGSDTQPIKWEQ